MQAQDMAEKGKTSSFDFFADWCFFCQGVQFLVFDGLGVVEV